MLRTDTEYAEWLINRSLKKGETRKMKRALNAALRRNRLVGNYERAARSLHELRKVARSMRKFRAYMAKEHPGGVAEVRITDDQENGDV